MKQSDSTELAGRVILVTGALEGVGRAVAKACAAAGATVIISSFREADLVPVYDEILAAGYPEPAMLPIDLASTDESLYQGIHDVIEQNFGRLDGLAHCAAYAPFLARVDDYDADAWQHVIQVNLTATFLLTQACLPLLRQSPDASIVFSSDRCGRRGRAFWGAYAAARFGIEGLMQVMAAELSNVANLRVNTMDPGVVQSTMRLTLFPGEDYFKNPLPEAIAGSYVKILGPAGKGIDGQALTAEVQR